MVANAVLIRRDGRRAVGLHPAAKNRRGSHRLNSAQEGEEGAPRWADLAAWPSAAEPKAQEHGARGPLADFQLTL